MISHDCLRDAVRHVRWAREDMAKGDHLQAMVNVIAANRSHAMSGVYGTPSWARVETLLRSTTKALWGALSTSVAQRRAA